MSSRLGQTARGSARSGELVSPERMLVGFPTDVNPPTSARASLWSARSIRQPGSVVTPRACAASRTRTRIIHDGAADAGGVPVRSGTSKCLAWLVRLGSHGLLCVRTMPRLSLTDRRPQTGSPSKNSHWYFLGRVWMQRALPQGPGTRQPVGSLAWYEERWCTEGPARSLSFVYSGTNGGASLASALFGTWHLPRRALPRAAPRQWGLGLAQAVLAALPADHGRPRGVAVPSLARRLPSRGAPPAPLPCLAALMAPCDSPRLVGRQRYEPSPADRRSGVTVRSRGDSVSVASCGCSRDSQRSRSGQGGTMGSPGRQTPRRPSSKPGRCWQPRQTASSRWDPCRASP